MLLKTLDLGDQTSHLKNHEMMKSTVKQPQATNTSVAESLLVLELFVFLKKNFWKTIR